VGETRVARPDGSSRYLIHSQATWCMLGYECGKRLLENGICEGEEDCSAEVLRED